MLESKEKDSHPLTLAEARRTGRIDEFIQDHDGDQPGDEEAFNRAVDAMAGKSKAAPAASKRRRSGD